MTEIANQPSGFVARGDYQVSFDVERAPAIVFKCVNNVREWWGGDIAGDTHHVGDTFTYRYGDVHYSKQVIVEMVPDRKTVWNVTEGFLSFVEDKREWAGTTVVFELDPLEQGTKVTFTHQGLTPEVQCFTAWSDAWAAIIPGSLKAYIETGKGLLDVLAAPAST